MVRRERQHAVVAPAAVAGKLADRHHLDQRDAEVDKVVEVLDRARERARGGERADVQLVDHGARQRAARASAGRSMRNALWSTTADGPLTPSGCHAERGSARGGPPSRENEYRLPGRQRIVADEPTAAIGRAATRRPVVGDELDARGPRRPHPGDHHARSSTDTGKLLRQRGDGHVTGPRISPVITFRHEPRGRWSVVARCRSRARQWEARHHDDHVGAPPEGDRRQRLGPLELERPVGGRREARRVPPPEREHGLQHRQLHAADVVRRPTRPARRRGRRACVQRGASKSTGRRLSGSTSESSHSSMPW